MKTRSLSTKQQIVKALLFTLATLTVSIAEASLCIDSLNREMEPESVFSSGATPVAQVQWLDYKVQIVLEQGNWSQKDKISKAEGSNGLLEGRVENAYRLRASLQELAKTPQFQQILGRPEGFVEIDFSAVDRISPEVLGTLLGFRKFLLMSYPIQTRGLGEENSTTERIRLVSVRPDVLSFLQMSAMDKVLSISVATGKP